MKATDTGTTRRETLQDQLTDLERAKVICERMLADEDISYEGLQIERYVAKAQDYLEDSRALLRMDLMGTRNV